MSPHSPPPPMLVLVRLTAVCKYQCTRVVGSAGWHSYSRARRFNREGPGHWGGWRTNKDTGGESEVYCPRGTGIGLIASRSILALPYSIPPANFIDQKKKEKKKKKTLPSGFPGSAEETFPFFSNDVLTAVEKACFVTLVGFCMEISPIDNSNMTSADLQNA